MRAILFDHRGGEIPGAASRREHSFRVTPDGGVEADADALFTLAAQCIDETLQKAGRSSGSIAGVAFTTFLHGLLGVSRKGRALTPVYCWADTRGEREAEELARSLDAEAARQRMGCVLHASYFPARLRWLARTSPDAFRQVHWWCSPGEYCHFLLFGARLCGLSVASATGLLDLRACRWDPEMLAAAGVEEASLSGLGGMDTPLSGLVEPYASRWPALSRVPWFPAAGDGGCNSVGSDCALPGGMAVMIGTSAAVRTVVNHLPPSLPRGLWCYRMDRERLLAGGVLGNGGNLRRWMTDSLALGLDAEAADAEILRRNPAGHGLTVLPFFTGERSTGWNPQARAAVVGMSLSTTALDILQAGMEAVAYRIAAVAELLGKAGLLEREELPAKTGLPRQAAPGPALTVASGGALMRSLAWTQIVADVLERPVTRSRAAEASCRGAALLALGALGLREDAEPLFGETVQPRLSHAARHREARARQEHVKRLLMDTGRPL